MQSIQLSLTVSHGLGWPLFLFHESVIFNGAKLIRAALNYICLFEWLLSMKVVGKLWCRTQRTGFGSLLGLWELSFAREQAKSNVYSLLHEPREQQGTEKKPTGAQNIPFPVLGGGSPVPSPYCHPSRFQRVWTQRVHAHSNSMDPRYLYTSVTCP